MRKALKESICTAEVIAKITHVAGWHLQREE
jgi:hypothetical protein